MAEGGSGRGNRPGNTAAFIGARRRRSLVKPAGWPRYMRAKRLSGGNVAYFWEPQTRDKRRDCPIHSEALGEDYAAAIERSKLLTEHLDSWRCGLNGLEQKAERGCFGTVSWLVDAYIRSSAFEKRVSQRSRYEYLRALRRIQDLPTIGGDRVAMLPVASITPAAVDKIYEKLQIGPRGPRLRQANLSLDIAKRAWEVVSRLHPTIVTKNPWRGVERNLAKNTKPAATRAEAYALAYALRDIGEPHLGAAALICFELHQRPEHVRAGDIKWTDYRPPYRPDAVQIRHPKTGAKGWVPLVDDQGLLFPELESYLASLPRLGLPIVLTAGRRGPARPYSGEYAQRKVREARQRASLGNHVTLDACRHGGLTELGDAGATEFEGMAASMHKTPQALRLYVKRSEIQRMSAARKRRLLIEKNR